MKLIGFDVNNNNNNYEDYIYQLKNVILGKYLIALYYYKDFIIQKPISLKCDLKY